MLRFLEDDSGAVTVDWVVMTGALVGLGLASAAAVRTGTGDLGAGIGTSLTDARVVGGTVASFDFNDVTGLTRTGWGWVTSGSFQGWNALGPIQQIEIVQSGLGGMHTPDGGNWIDLDASPGNLTLAHGLGQLTEGATYTLNFNAAGWHGRDNGVAIYFGGERVTHITPTTGSFNAYSVEFVAGTGNGSNQIEFRGTGTPDNFGVGLHGIEITRPLGQR